MLKIDSIQSERERSIYWTGFWAGASVIGAIFAILLLIATSARAQQQPLDPAALQKAITALQTQRNAAMDQAAGLQVQAAMLSEENAKLKARVEELEKAAAPPAK